MNLRFYCGFLLCCSILAHGQSGATAESLVRYDPAFWKSQLRLSTTQRERIQSINSSFYDHILIAARQDNKDRDRLMREVMNSARERSLQIWEVFNNRQKKRWEKIMLEYIE